MNDNNWQWTAIHQMLCNEPRAHGLADRAIRHPSPENAQAFAGLFESLGHADLAEFCRNVHPSYQAFPSERIALRLFNEKRPLSLPSAKSDGEIDDESPSEADRERCYLVNSTMVSE